MIRRETRRTREVTLGGALYLAQVFQRRRKGTVDIKIGRGLLPAALIAVLMTEVTAVAVARLTAQGESAKKAPAAAQDVIDSAVRQAKAEKKTVLLDFSASW